MLAPHNLCVAYLPEVSKDCYSNARKTKRDLSRAVPAHQDSAYRVASEKKIGREAKSFCVFKFKKANRFFSAPLNNIPQQEPHRPSHHRL